MKFLHLYAFETKEQFLQRTRKEYRDAIEELLCAAYLLDRKVEFSIDRFVYHYEYVFKFYTGKKKFYLSFKLKSDGGMDYAILMKTGCQGGIKKIASSLENNTNVTDVINKMKLRL